MEEEDQMLHVTLVGGGEPFLAPTTKDGDPPRTGTGPGSVSPPLQSDSLRVRMRSVLSVSLKYKHISGRPFRYSVERTQKSINTGLHTVFENHRPYLTHLKAYLPGTEHHLGQALGTHLYNELLSIT